MSGFTPEWLSQRETVDRRARDQGLLARLQACFHGRERTTVCELGAGSGALLRALAPQLPDRQEWRLIDADPENLAAARSSLAAWAEESRDQGAGEQGAGLHLIQAGREIAVTFERRDLSDGLAGLPGEADLVAASALFDLAGPAWLGALAEALAAGRVPFYASLTYSGTLAAEPPQPLDAGIALAFGAHQRSDKGLGGVAAGPSAQGLLRAALETRGAAVAEGDSTWQLGDVEADLRERMICDYAQVALETGLLPPAAVAAWREAHLRSCRQLSVGHRDLFATWPDAA